MQTIPFRPSIRRWVQSGAAPSVLLAAVIAFMAGVLAGWQGIAGGVTRARLVQGVEIVRIAEGGIDYTARVDSGAAISSVNARNIAVDGGDAEDPRKNIGRTVHFTLDNGHGQSAEVDAEIIDVKSVRTGDCREWRYHVHLTVDFGGRTANLLVNLNDRSALGEKMLLGRNWLETGNYVIAVSDR